MLHAEVWRLLNAGLSAAVFFFLLMLGIAFQKRRGWDYTLRCLGFAMVMAVAAYASIAALKRHLPTQDYNGLLGLALAFCLITLLTPWHWPAAIRRHRHR